MAKTETKYKVDANEAINAINKLEKSVDSYNKTIEASEKSQKKLKRSSAELKKAIAEEAENVQKLVSQHKRLANEERTRLEERKKFSNLTRDEFNDLQKLIQQNRRLAQEENKRITAKRNLAAATKAEQADLDRLIQQHRKLRDEEARRIKTTEDKADLDHLIRQNRRLASEEKERIETKRNIEAITKAEQADLDRLIQQHRLLRDEEARRIKASEEQADLDHLIRQHKRLASEEKERIATKERINRLSETEQADLERLIRQHKRLKAEEASRIAIKREAPVTGPRAAFVGGVKPEFIPSAGRAARGRSADDVFNELRSVIRAADATKLWGKAIDGVQSASNKKNKVVKKQTDLVDADAAAARNASTSSDHLRRAWVSLISVGVLLSRGINELINAIRQSIQDAAELSKRIAEVQTVSLELSNGVLKTAKNTREWKDELQALSRTFGINTLETTEALYEALSNQVVQAGNSTNFMAQQMKLAITAVSTLDEAVDVTSTVMNAFNKNTTEAARINAVLFKAVDLGRFRLNELGSEFGRVSVLSKQLGISFEEQAGAIALLTRLGLNADVAQTLLTNVQLKLIKPTEVMTKLFGQWGVTSGEAAIRTFGFSNVIQKLASETERGGDQMAELGEIFQDLRAITGAQGLVSNFDDLQQTINQVSNATAAYNEAFSLSLDAIGRKADIELEKLRQQFLNTFGERLLRAFINVSEAFGGADKALASLLKTGLIAAEVYIGYRAALIAVSAAQAVHNVRTSQSTVFLQSNTTAANANRSALIGLTAAQAAATAGITLLIAGISHLVAESATVRDTLNNSFLQLRSNLLETSREEIEKTINKIDEFSISVERSNSSIFRSYFQFLASIRSVNTALTEDFNKKFKKIRDVMADGLKVSTDVLEDRLKALTKRIEDVKKATEDLRERAVKARVEADDKAFETSLVGKTDKEALRATFERKAKLDAEALSALRRGELDLADELFRRTERLADDAERRIEELKRKVKSAADEISARVSSTGASAITAASGGVSRTFSRSAPGRPRITRGGPFGSAITRSAPRSAVSVTRKTELVDTERLRLLEEALLTLRRDAAKVEKEKVAAIEAGLRAKEAEKRRLDEEVKARTKSVESFKKLVAEIDTFDTTQENAASKFGKLLTDTEAAGRAAGLSPEEQLQFLRQANATRILLEREARTKAAREALDIESKAIKEAESKADEARKRRVDAEKKAAEQIEAFANQNIETSARLRGEFDRPGFGQFGEIVAFGTDEERERIEQKKREFLETLKNFENLNNKLLVTRREGGDTANVLREIAAAQAQLNAQLNDLDKRKNLTRVGFGKISPAPRDSRGRLIFEKEPGKPEQALVDLIKQSQEALAKVTASLNEARAATANFSFANDAMAKLRDTLSSIPPAFREQAQAAAESKKATVDAATAINRVHDGTLARLYAIIKAHNEIEAARRRERELIDAAGPVVPRAAGGSLPGTDRNLVALSKGEFVMNRLATRTYAPLLRAMNGITPLPRSGGGNTVNFGGDINVTTHSSTTDAQALEIAHKLERLMRRGLFSVKG
jgi:TP901 family phage tail tape measure protein